MYMDGYMSKKISAVAVILNFRLTEKHKNKLFRGSYKEHINSNTYESHYDVCEKIFEISAN